MCCALISFLLFGPRLAGIVWWIVDPSRWASTFPSLVWPILGIIFLPITTLVYMLVYSNEISSLDWILIIVAIIIDMGVYGGGASSRKKASA